MVDATATSVHYFLHTLQQSWTKAVHVIVLVYVLADSVSVGRSVARSVGRSLDRSIDRNRMTFFRNFDFRLLKPDSDAENYGEFDFRVESRPTFTKSADVSNFQ